ncbi:hypothetical protein HK096_001058, partial [Nowakowskiella sp. JEL0078]
DGKDEELALEVDEWAFDTFQASQLNGRRSRVQSKLSSPPRVTSFASTIKSNKSIGIGEIVEANETDDTVKGPRSTTSSISIHSPIKDLSFVKTEFDSVNPMAESIEKKHIDILPEEGVLYQAIPIFSTIKIPIADVPKTANLGSSPSNATSSNPIPSRLIENRYPKGFPIRSPILTSPLNKNRHEKTFSDPVEALSASINGSSQDAYQSSQLLSHHKQLSSENSGANRIKRIGESIMGSPFLLPYDRESIFEELKRKISETFRIVEVLEKQFA